MQIAPAGGGLESASIRRSIEVNVNDRPRRVEIVMSGIIAHVVSQARAGTGLRVDRTA